MEVSMTNEIQAPRGAIWAADAAVFIIDLVGRCIDILKPESSALESCKNSVEVVQYAFEIEDAEPEMSRELKAIASHVSS
jgi:hypothetical protein